MLIGAREESRKKTVGSLRSSQSITTFGTGSIVDLPDYSVIMGATDYWDSRSPIIHEPNLERLLGMSHFKQPKVTETNSGYPGPDLPAFRFPNMHFCPGCKRLMPYRSFGDEEGKKCLKCKNKALVPSRFIAACINGHIEDFPYKWWAHYGNLSSCTEPNAYDKLKIEFKSDSGGLGSIVIECSACGAKRSMEGCMGKDALSGFKCKGNRPWLGKSKAFYDPEQCSAPMRTLQRGASNVYFTVTSSALTIPPWSSRIQVAIEGKWEVLQSLILNKPSEETLRYILKNTFKDLLEKGAFTESDLLNEVERRKLGHSNENEFEEKDIIQMEYKALCAGDIDDPLFKAEICETPNFVTDYISKVVLVKRLREVLALRGFRRIMPEPPSENDDRAIGFNGSDCIPLGSHIQNWLPAIELLGEGIFIKLNMEAILKWEELNADRYGDMTRRLGSDSIGRGKYSPRYVLLHTLSHLIIKQLSMDCGYSGASLKERIYSTYLGSQNQMGGILIYTASSDSDGSLGGLVRQGAKERLEHTLRNMLQEASWCSSDPLCIQSKAQGFNSLNYAACHACCLLPETSCEARNCLLDRASIVGTIDNREIGFFGKIFEE